jgi:hypothetical protein
MGCLHNDPYALVASDRPVNERLALGEAVSEDGCRTWFLGLIPLNRPTRLLTSWTAPGATPTP